MIRLVLPMLLGIALGWLIFDRLIKPYMPWNRQDSVKSGPRPPYQWYETPELIAAKWHDSKLIDMCETCGLDDAPIVVGDEHWRNTKKCKWCVELEELVLHRAKQRSR